MLRFLLMVCAIVAALCVVTDSVFSFGHHVKVVGTETVQVPTTMYVTETQEVTVKVPVTTYVEKKVQKQVIVPQSTVTEVSKPVFAKTVRTAQPYQGTRRALRFVDVPTTRYTLVEEQIILDNPIGFGLFGTIKARKAEARAAAAIANQDTDK